MRKGLPQADAIMGVCREGTTTDRREPAGASYVASTGKPFAARDDFDRWTAMAENLPPIYSVAAAKH
jgi:hypothetical protein